MYIFMHAWMNESIAYLRSCLSCGRTFFKVDLYCETCWREVFLEIDPREYSEGLPFKVKTLFFWQDSSVRIPQLLRDLKGPLTALAMKRIAFEMAKSRRFLLEKPYKEYMMFPCPSRRPYMKDHSFGLALALSELFSAKLRPDLLLSKSGFASGPQKRLNRFSRLSRDRIECIGELPSEASVIFIDDLVTTGSTAIAAYKALGCPTDFEVWAIACRKREVLL